MSRKKFDIAIIGDSLGARIAATLLAKRGCKVLSFMHRKAETSAWFHSSLFLEQVLATLGGRSCFVAQKPIQVLSSRARVTLNNDISLESELHREFGSSAAIIANWLERLRVNGERLENLYWENGGLSWPSFKPATRFKLLCLRRKINTAEFNLSVSKSFAQLSETAVDFVVDLLQGLSMKNIDQLSHASAAMLWSQAMLPENLKEPDFSDLLNKRFEQFHGLNVPFEDLEKLESNGSRWTGGQLKDGGLFTATEFLLGDSNCLHLFEPGKAEALPLPQTVSLWKTGPLTGQLSSLLASRIICGGDFPVSLTIEERESHCHGLVRCVAGITEEQLQRQLEVALPFAKYKLEEETPAPNPLNGASAQQQGLASLSLKTGKNLYCADNNALLPEMGAAGAALLGWTLAENLASRPKQGKV